MEITKIVTYFVGTQEFSRQSLNTRESTLGSVAFENQKLSELIAIRKDVRGTGFIHNIKKNIILYADQEALDCVSGLLENRLCLIKKKILKKLYIYD